MKSHYEQWQLSGRRHSRSMLSIIVYKRNKDKHHTEELFDSLSHDCVSRNADPTSDQTVNLLAAVSILATRLELYAGKI